MRGNLTLEQVKAICKKGECSKCMFKTKGRKMCQFETAPVFWDLESPPKAKTDG